MELAQDLASACRTSCVPCASGKVWHMHTKCSICIPSAPSACAQSAWHNTERARHS